MSGDVQPRKRKDKRKKRDDRKSEGDVSILRQPSFQDDEDASSHGVHITKMGNDDVHLHVQHQHGTGGHWCAKIIFFSLMAVLLGLVGLIIMENRGLEDLDTPLSESRYSNYFDGWVEEHRQEEHDAHDAHDAAIDQHDDHDDDEHDDEPEEEYELHSGEEEEEEADHEEDAHDEEADDDDEEEENTAAENVTAEDDEKEEEGDEDDEADEESLEPAQSAVEDEDEDADEEGIEESIEPPVSHSKTQSAPETAEDEDEEEDIEEEEDEDDAEEIISQSQAESAAATAEDDNDDDIDDDNDDVEEEEEEIEESAEPAAQSVPETAEDNNDDDDDVDDFDQDDNDDDDDDFESLDQELENDAEEQLLQEKQRQANAQAKPDQNQDKPEDDKDEEPATTTSWLGSLAVKFGVGIALALVSRLVLIRKNPNTNEEEPTQEANMRRRLTIATAEDNIPDDLEDLPPLDDEEYSEEEIEIEEEFEVEISDLDEEAEAEASDDNNVALSASYVPETFEQLSAMYRAKTAAAQPEPVKEPSKEPEPKKKLEPEPKPATATATGTATDLYVEYEDGDIEDYEHEESEEEDDDEISNEEEDEISDVDDAELMNRLEAKYGRLPAKEYESDPDSDDPSWTQIKPKAQTGAQAEEEDTDIDDLFEQELRQANAEMINENYAAAIRAFNKLTHTYAHVPAAHLYRAQTLELLAEKQRSNQLLRDAIESLKRYLAFAELITNHSEYRAAGERCIKHLRFLGHPQQAVGIHEQLIERFPDEVEQRNQLSHSYLMSNNLKQMQKVAAETLQRWPKDAVAQLHFGLALRQLQEDYAKALPYLQYAIDSQAKGTQEAYFYMALGETLQRLGRQRQAVQIYQRGVEKQFFASIYQRSLYNVPRLRAQPFWQRSETGYAAELEQLQRNWPAIRNEALSLLNSHAHFKPEAEKLRHKGNWQQFELFARGKRLVQNCQRAPLTCSLIDKLPAASSCRRGQVKFSAMREQTHVWPHCGPTNCRLRAHLTLVAPEPHLTSLRVAEQQRTWKPGDLFIFDDSFEHEVWHNGTQLRLVLILDLWHPDLSESQRRSLAPI